MNANKAPLGIADHVNARVNDEENFNAMPSLQEMHQGIQGIELDLFRNHFKEIHITLGKRQWRKRKIVIERRREMEDQFIRNVYTEDLGGSFVIEDGAERGSKMPYHEEALLAFREIIPWLHPEVGILFVGNEEQYRESTDAMFKDVVGIMRNHRVRLVRTLYLYSRYPEFIDQFLHHVRVGSLKTLNLNFGTDGEVRLADLPHLRAHIPHLEDLNVFGSMMVPLQTVAHLHSVFSKIAPFTRTDVAEYKQNVLEKAVIRKHRLVVSHPLIMERRYKPQITFGDALDENNKSSAREEFEARRFYDNDMDILPDWIYRFRSSENEYLMVTDNERDEMVVEKHVVNLAQIEMF